MNFPIGDYKKVYGILLASSLIVFLGLFFIFPVGMYADSVQYINMHIHREPGYCLFLFVFREIFGEGYLVVCAFLQNVLAAFTTTYFVYYLYRTFSLRWLEIAGLFLLNLVPHVLTPFFSVEHVILTNGIMSEALAYPCFLLFLVETHKMLMQPTVKSTGRAFTLAFCISLIRSQLMAVLLVWMIAALVAYWLQRKPVQLVLICLMTVLAFGGRGLVTKCYNYVFNEKHFIQTTYGGVNTLTNMLFAASPEAGDRITDPQAKECFYLMYDAMVANHWSMEDAGEDLLDVVIFLESNHDNIKFECVEKILADYLEKQGILDYYEKNVLSDQISAKIMKAILPDCLFTWSTHYLLLAFRGMIRSVGMVAPYLTYLSLLFLVVAVGLFFWGLGKKDFVKEEGFLFLSLLSTAGVSFSTAITIMCLSRYMIYNFVGFYAALFLCGIWIIKKKQGGLYGL